MNEHVQETLALAYTPDNPRSSAHPATVVPLPTDLRPAERLRDVGVSGLSSSELLALVLGGAAADRRSVAAALGILTGTGGLVGLRGATLHDLMETEEVGEARATRVMAAVELGKRLSDARAEGRPVITSPKDVYDIMKDRLRDLDRECFVAVLLNTKNEVIEAPTISVGTLSSSLVHPREVFKPAIKASAASIILVHNHPSGNTRPSAEDIVVTQRIVDSGRTLGIEVLDHVIVGSRFLSMKEDGSFPKAS